jgi:hypothetical protein
MCKNKEWEGMEWMYLTQGRNKWQAITNFVINLRVP